MFVKITVVGVMVCLISMFMKRYFKEFVLPVEILFLTLTVVTLTETVSELISQLTDVIDFNGYSENVFKTIIKGAGICLLTKFTADMCQENGNGLVADVIEFSARIMLTVIAFPYIKAVIGIAVGFLE